MADRDLVMALAKVVIAAAWADGEVAHDEIAHLKQLLIRLRAAGSLRGIELSGQQWAELDMYIEWPIGPDERARLVVALQEELRTTAQRQLALEAVRDMMLADGEVTEGEQRVLAELVAGIGEAPVGLAGALERLMGGRMRHQRQLVAGAPNRERSFEDFLHNRVYYFLQLSPRRTLGLPEAELRKLALAAGLMAKIAHVDGTLTADEIASVARAIKSLWQIDEDAAEHAAAVALEAVDRTYDTARMMSTLAAAAPVAERREILTAIFGVASADGTISLVEHEEIRLIAIGLNLTHRDFVKAKQAVLDGWVQDGVLPSARSGNQDGAFTDGDTMTTRFDEIIDRRGSMSVKWETIHKGNELIYGDHADPRHGRNQILPLWVADMDFLCPPAVIEAVRSRAEHGIFGYSYPDDAYFASVIGWISRRYGWQAEKEWLCLTPGVVPAINALIATFVEPGQKVLVQRPVYHPFFEVITSNEAQIVSNSLVFKDGRYWMDSEDLAEKVADPDVRMAILCSPHNPVGRVWSADELRRFGEICLANDVLVVADEIHCDLIYSHAHFTSFATLGEPLLQNSIICTAASKTFNLAGLKLSNIVVPNPDLRARFNDTLRRRSQFGANPFGLVATKAAYERGEPWLEEVMAYVEANYRFMAEYIAEHLPALEVIRPDGTYLVWVDCRRLGLDPAKRKQMMMEKARVYLDEGEMFGPEGEGFERFNIACPRAILHEALDRIREVVQSESIE